MSSIVLPDTIYLAAKMGCGKDYVAQQLVSMAGFTKVAFADALKEEVADRAGVTVAHIESNKAEYRAELQRWGGVRRAEDVDYWVKRFAERRASVSGPVVNTDTRFPNEGFYVLRTGGLLVMLTLPEEVRIGRLTARDGHFNPAWMEDTSEKHYASLPWHLSIETDQTPGDYPALISAGYVALLAEKQHQRRAA